MWTVITDLDSEAGVFVWFILLAVGSYRLRCLISLYRHCMGIENNSGAQFSNFPTLQSRLIKTSNACRSSTPLSVLPRRIRSSWLREHESDVFSWWRNTHGKRCRNVHLCCVVLHPPNFPAKAWMSSNTLIELSSNYKRSTTYSNHARIQGYLAATPEP